MTTPNVLQLRSRRRHRGYGTCLRCVEPWSKVEGHSTSYGRGMQSCFPLCEPCWQALSPEQRLPYYQILILEVWENGEADWPSIKQAVLDGK